MFLTRAIRRAANKATVDFPAIPWPAPPGFRRAHRRPERMAFRDGDSSLRRQKADGEPGR